MIFELVPDKSGNLTILKTDDNTWDYFSVIKDCFSNAYVGCYDGYENCIWFRQ